MKEVKFRWVDRYLIHLTISEKFLITFWCPLVFIAFLTWYLLADGHDQAMQLRVDQLKGRVETTAQLVSQQPTLTLPADLVLTPGAATGLSQQGDIYRYGASAGQAGVVSGTLDTSHYALWDGQGTTLTIIAVLAALLALITHYLMTFVSGALYSTNSPSANAISMPRTPTWWKPWTPWKTSFAKSTRKPATASRIPSIR